MIGRSTLSADSRSRPTASDANTISVSILHSHSRSWSRNCFTSRFRASARRGPADELITPPIAGSASGPDTAFSIESRNSIRPQPSETYPSITGPLTTATPLDKHVVDDDRNCQRHDPEHLAIDL